MTEDEYKILCKECDSILKLIPNSIAVPSLHVIKEHPSLLRKYKRYFRKKSLTSVKFWIAFYAKIISLICFQLIRAIFKGGLNGPIWQSENIERGIDTIFISHLLSARQLSKKNDIYFGSIPSIAEEKGIKCGIVFLDHANFTSKSNALRPFKTKNVFILSSACDLQTEFYLVLRSIKIAKSILEIKSNSISIHLIRWAALEAVSRDTCSALRVEHQIDNLLSQTFPKKILLTWEGHAWERLVTAQTKRDGRDIKCIGYQHAVVSKLQYSSRRSLGSYFDPDSLWSSGERGAIRMKEGTLLIPDGIYNIGTHRVSSSEKRIIRHKREISTILVIPEGILEECELLFSYSLDCAIKDPDLNFIWRLHPLFDFKMLKKNFPQYRDLPNNIFLSEKDLDDDIACSTHVLYRGSTAVIPALINQVRPIYLSIPNEMTIDPLYDLKEWKIIAVIQENLRKNIIERDNASSCDIENAIKFGISIYNSLSKKAVEEQF